VKRFFGFLLVVLFCSFVFSSSVVRDFPTVVSPNQEFKVSLAVSVSAEDTFYGIEEWLPDGFVVVNPDGGDISLKYQIKWLNINAIPGEGAIIYTLRAPSTPGKYVFDGQSMFETQEAPVRTGGDSEIVVSEEPLYSMIFYSTLIILVIVVTLYILLYRGRMREGKRGVVSKKRK
jgi:hypothetical protein